uniref:Uncharacterized protein n=1 Tax=Oryza sativa subsp. japonica TaxID=39947 RepID=Q84ST8_ORYSJ|nr:hypothetical protein OSJNBa0092N01.20 [Oryza sativa Japonica Group]
MPPTTGSTAQVPRQAPHTDLPLPSPPATDPPPPYWCVAAVVIRDVIAVNVVVVVAESTMVESGHVDMGHGCSSRTDQAYDHQPQLTILPRSKSGRSRRSWRVGRASLDPDPAFEQPLRRH